MLAVGPAVLGFLIQAVTGAIVATDSAAWRMAVLEEVAFEREHTSPSAVDLAFYTTDRSPIWVRALRLTVYPAYLTAFLGEGGFLAYRMLQPGWWTRIEAVDPSPTVQWLRYPLLVVGVLLLLCALPRLGILWWRKIAHATMMLRNKNTPVQVSRAMSILADITDTLRGAGRKVESRVARGYYTLHVDDQTVLRSRSLQGLATRTREWYKTQPAETPSDGSKSVTR